MSVFNVVRPIVNPIVRSIVNPRGGGFAGLLNLYPGAAAAYSLRALSSGWLAGDVVEVRPSHGAAAQSFTASQITGGAMLDFVNNGTTDLYNSARYFNGTSTEVTIPDSPDFTISTSIDVSADVLLTSTTPSGIVNKGVGAGGAREWSLTVNASNQLEFIVFDESLSTNVSASTSDFPTNELFTARGYYDGSDVYIYVNGVQKATTTGVIAIENLAADIQIGNTLAASRHLHGIVSNVSILVDGTEVAAYTGLGTSVTAWQDTIGSNIGTETNGAAYTGQPFDGFVSTWYDQSGNGNDAIQATTTQQPKIVSAGSLVTGGLDFDGVDDGLKTNHVYTDTIQAATMLVVSQNDLTSGQQSMVRIRPNGIAGVADGFLWEQGIQDSTSRYGPNTFIEGGGSGVGATFAGQGAQDTTQHLNTLIFQKSQVLAYEDGALDETLATVKSGSLPVGDVTLNDELWIGRNFDSNDREFNGTMREVILYFGDQSANRLAIETNINAAYSIY